MSKQELMTHIKNLLPKLSNKYSYVEVSKLDINCTNTELNDHTGNKRNRDNLLIGSNLFGRHRLIKATCKVCSNGYILDGKEYESLSKAAKAVTGAYTDGWKFWKVEDFGDSVLDNFRKSMEKI